MKLTVLISLAILNLWLLMGSCKPLNRNTSEVKTLDQLAGLSSALVQCGAEKLEPHNYPSYKDKQIVAGQYEAQVKRALTAVPNAFVDFFFKVLKGNLVIQPEPVMRTACNNISNEAKDFMASSQFQNIGGCLTTTPVADKPSGYNMVIQDNPDAILNMVVKLMSFVYSDLLIEKLPKVANSGVKIDENLKKFLVDKGAIEIKNLDDFGETWFNDLRSKKDKNSESFNKIMQLKNSNPNLYRQFAFMNAFDSWYCNGNTRRDFKTHFNTSYRKFTSLYGPFGPSKAESK